MAAPDEDETAAPPRRLLDAPPLVYLLREIDALYRHGSAGGSRAIRAHRRKVRERLSGVLDGNPPLSRRPPQAKPVTVHLPRALDTGRGGALSGLARALSHIAADLVWEHGYLRVPKGLEKKYAYSEILGPQGPVVCADLILGFVLFAPRTTYPQHNHHEIEESYISVSGAWSENDAAVYAPGSLILNRPGVEHRITSGDHEPCLLAYAWIGPPDRLAAPGMRFSPPRRPPPVQTP